MLDQADRHDNRLKNGLENIKPIYLLPSHVPSPATTDEIIGLTIFSSLGFPFNGKEYRGEGGNLS